MARGFTAMRPALVALALAAVRQAGAAPGGPPVKQADFEAFFYSSSGLDMTRNEARALAAREARNLTVCRVTVHALQDLRDAMYSSSSLDMLKSELREALLPAAYHQVGADQLKLFFSALYSSSGADMFKADAKTHALTLAKRHVDPGAVQSLFRSLYRSDALDLQKSQAQHEVVRLVAAGADAQAFSQSVEASRGRGMSKETRLRRAAADAVVAGLQGLVRRYARDGLPYTAREFLKEYPETWLDEWLAAPEEKRTARDGNDYSAGEYQRYFGRAWAAEWGASPEAVQRRIAADGKVYTLDEFRAWSRAWQPEWAKAREVPDACAFLNRDACTSRPAADRCQWTWSGDWLDSCVPKPRAATLLV